jgi:HlyD family secretion protein
MVFRIIGSLCLGLMLLMGNVASGAKGQNPEKPATPALAADAAAPTATPTASAEKKDEKKKGEKKKNEKKDEKKGEKKKGEKKEDGKPTPTKTAEKAAPAEKQPPAEPPKKPAAEPSKPTPPTHTVKKEVLKIQVEIGGMFEAEEMAELVLRPKDWTLLSVLSAVPQGTKVKKGDVVLKLDPEKLDRALADVRTELRLAEINLQQGRQQLAALEKTTPLDLEAGQRAQRHAEEDQKYYFAVDRPETLKAADMSLKNIRKYLEYERQELEQLEKMYKADDLVEETEKIVLQRQRDTVERMEYYLHTAEVNHNEILKFMIPRRDEQITDAAQRRSIQWQKAKIDLPLALDQQRLEMKKLEVQIARNREKSKNLERDRGLMTVTAPQDGIVYYGRCQRGKFNESAALTEALRRGGGIAPNQIFMTIAAPRPVFLRAMLQEAELKDLHVGSQGTAVPTASPDSRLSATIEQIDAVPLTPGVFDAKLDVTLEAKDKAILPGMSCKVKFTPYVKTDALTVPPKAVFSEPENDDEHYVYVLDAQGKPEKRSVTVGRETDKQAEILKGLRAGDKILLEEPKDEK